MENLDGTIMFYKNHYPQNPGDPFGELIASSYLTYIFTEPLLIVDRSGEPDSITNISTTWHKDPINFPSMPVFKGTVVKAAAFKPGSINSPANTNTYFVCDEGNDRYSIPVISLSTNNKFLFDYEDGIYVAGVDFDNWRISNPGADVKWSSPANYRRRGVEWEYPANLEFFDENGDLKFNQKLGYRIHGGWARSLPVKSFRLYAGNIYGNSMLNYPFFH
jgi:hypothetical protein